MTLCPNSLTPVKGTITISGAWCDRCWRVVPVVQGKYVDHEEKYEPVVNKEKEI